MTKKLIAFDYDDTIAVTKAAITDRMAFLLVQLLEKYEVCVITGDTFEKIKPCVVDRLEATPSQLMSLHLMPASGTRYYRYDENGDWRLHYADELTEHEKKRMTHALEKCAKELGYWEAKTYGAVIEDRGSQITFSALGRKAPAEERYQWDPTGEKKWALAHMVGELLPEFEVRPGGTTSIDVTRVGFDKAYGMNKLMKELAIDKDDILFVGDNLQEGGNDYPVKAMGIDCIAVEKWEDTAFVIEGILSIS